MHIDGTAESRAWSGLSLWERIESCAAAIQPKGTNTRAMGCEPMLAISGERRGKHEETTIPFIVDTDAGFRERVSVVRVEGPEKLRCESGVPSGG